MIVSNNELFVRTTRIQYDLGNNKINTKLCLVNNSKTCIIMYGNVLKLIN